MSDHGETHDVNRRTMLLSGLALASGIAAAPIFPGGAEKIISKGHDGLRTRANRKGLLCGTAVSYKMLSDPSVRKALADDCNIIVPENELKWSRLQPTKDGPFAYQQAEAIYDYAHGHDLKVRGTCLHWWNGQPKWAADYIPTLSSGQAGDFLDDYVRKVTTHWKGRLVHWDVVNEEVDGRGNLIDKLFAPKLGERLMDICFNVVKEVDPDSLRVYNINYVEQTANYNNMMRPQVLRQLEGLVKRGVPVQCLGIQSHLTTMDRFSQATYRKFLDEVSAMGLKLLVTEFDVSDRGTIGDFAKRDAASAALGKEYLDVILDYPNCLGLLTWGPSDKDHWLRRTTDKQRRDMTAVRAAPLDDKYSRKPLWHVIANAIDGAPPR